MITEARPYLAPRLELANSNAPLMHRHIAWQGRSSGETVAKGRDPKVPVPDMLAIRPSALGRHCPACRSSALALSVAVDGQLAPSTGALSVVHIPQSPFERTRCAGDASRARGQRGRVESRLMSGHKEVPYDPFTQNDARRTRAS